MVIKIDSLVIAMAAWLPTPACRNACLPTGMHFGVQARGVKIVPPHPPLEKGGWGDLKAIF